MSSFLTTDTARAILRKAGLVAHRWPSPGSLEKVLHLQLPRLRVDCVFDVGANVGQYVDTLRQIGFTGQIISFEPVEACAETLRAAALRDPRWQVMSHALGVADGTLPLNVSNRTEFSSALLLNEYGSRYLRRASEGTHVDVPVHRLDQLYPDLERQFSIERPFLKLDTQGSDLAVLDGASGCLERFVGLQIELSLKPLYDGMPDISEALDVIRSKGFDPVGFAPVSSDPSGALIELDCVAQRR